MTKLANGEETVVDRKDAELPPEACSNVVDEDSSELKMKRRGCCGCRPIHPIASFRFFLQNNMVTKIWRQVGWRFVFVVCTCSKRTHRLAA